MCTGVAATYNLPVCTLAIYFRQSTNLPLVVAANRDEFYVRPTADPGLLSVHPWTFGGQDLSAGGTWFGVNERRTIAGLLNRRSPEGPDPSRRSRGLLCLEALQQGGPDEVIAWLRTRAAADYNRFNLLVADSDRAFVTVNDGITLSIAELPPGLHVLTNTDVGDPTCPRRARAHQLFARLSLDGRSADSLPAALRSILSDHDHAEAAGDPTAALCVHTPAYGTRSSSIVAFARAQGRMRFWHATGAPCAVDYVETQLPDAASG